MFEASAVTLLDRAERRTDVFRDEHLQVTLDAGDVDVEQSANRLLFPRKLHDSISQLVKDSAKLIVRQDEDRNGFETWRGFSSSSHCHELRGACHFLPQLLDFKFNPALLSRTLICLENEQVEV